MEQGQALLTAYTEVCKSYHAISDFRGKLLALIPIVSGTGISLLLNKTDSVNSSHLLAAGAFGMFVTLGLFFYELRGIQRCKYLISIGGELESELGMTRGQFKDRPGRIYGFIGSEIAGWVIYTAVLLGWIYIAAIGVRSLYK
ncbi:MAG: hypothetical protein ND866_30870 [Pyrinomonadaceae bacterium]|nr:hypothetical protein [Pyrinomonadaceae bacterium]